MQALLLHMPVYLHVHMLHQKYHSIIFVLAVFRLKINYFRKPICYEPISANAILVLVSRAFESKCLNICF